MSNFKEIQDWKKRNKKVKNVLLFVSDALRWDYLPESVAQRGIAFKTIAASIFTASSFPSIITGLYPYRHGVYSFFDKLPKNMTTLLNLSGYNTTLWTENTWVYFPRGGSQLHRILQHKNATRLEELEPPFIYLEHEKGGHCPYGWTDADAYREDDCKKFFRDYGRKRNEELRKRYQMGIERSVKEFGKRIKILEERKLLDSTLIIFLSDHGELLGEYGGIIGHGNITTPELVYVPTVFIHPDLPKGVSFENDGILRHVDLFPTILDLLNIKVKRKVDGISFFNAEKIPDFGYTYWKLEVKKEWLLNASSNLKLEERSIWDKNGGYLFRGGANLLLRLLRTIHLTTSFDSIESVYLKGKLRQMPLQMLRNYVEILKIFCSSSMRYGSPSFDFKDAQELIKEVKEIKISAIERNRIKSKLNKLKKEGKNLI